MLELEAIEQAIARNKHKNAPFNEAFTSCLSKPCPLRKCNLTRDTDLTKSTDADNQVDAYTRMIRCRTDIIGAQLKILQKEAEQSTTSSAPAAAEKSTERTAESDDSTDNDEESSRCKRKLKPETKHSWPQLLVQMKHMFSVDPDAKIDENIFGSSDCIEWIQKMRPAEVNSAEEHKDQRKGLEYKHINSVDVANSIRDTVDGLLAARDVTEHGNCDISSFVRLIRPFSFVIDDNEDTSDSKVVDCPGCSPVAALPRKSALRKTDFMEINTDEQDNIYNRDKNIEVLERTDEADATNTKAKAMCEIKSLCFQSDVERSICDPKHERKRKRRESSKVVVQPSETRCTEYEVPPLSVWRTSYLHHQNLFRDQRIRSKSLSSRPVIYKDSADFLIPLFPLSSHSAQCASKYADSTYKSLAASICAQSRDSNKSGIHSISTKNEYDNGIAAAIDYTSALNEYDNAIKEADASFNWPAAMQNVQAKRVATSMLVFTSAPTCEKINAGIVANSSADIPDSAAEMECHGNFSNSTPLKNSLCSINDTCRCDNIVGAINDTWLDDYGFSYSKFADFSDSPEGRGKSQACLTSDISIGNSSTTPMIDGSNSPDDVISELTSKRSVTVVIPRYNSSATPIINMVTHEKKDISESCIDMLLVSSIGEIQKCIQLELLHLTKTYSEKMFCAEINISMRLSNVVSIYPKSLKLSGFERCLVDKAVEKRSFVAAVFLVDSFNTAEFTSFQAYKRETCFGDGNASVACLKQNTDGKSWRQIRLSYNKDGSSAGVAANCSFQFYPLRRTEE